MSSLKNQNKTPDCKQNCTPPSKTAMWLLKCSLVETITDHIELTSLKEQNKLDVALF